MTVKQNVTVRLCLEYLSYGSDVFFFLFAVSENKVLCHPSSVDSLSTSAGTEDHVSMGGWSARKAIKVVENVERGMVFIFVWVSCQMNDTVL